MQATDAEGQLTGRSGRITAFDGLIPEVAAMQVHPRYFHGGGNGQGQQDTPETEQFTQGHDHDDGHQEG